MGLESKLEQHQKKIQIGYLILLFLFSCMWMWVQPLNASPDEGMRYLVPQYIYNHGRLPVGSDPEIINWAWGSSYGFNPITSYIISALFMKITAVFTTDATALLMAARLVSVLFGVANAYVVIKIAEKLFEGKRMYQWLFIVFATLLPEVVFITSYVNIDAMALFGTSLTIYCWILGMESDWRYRNCIALGASLSVCILSYYNTYGFLVCSFLLFVIYGLWLSEKGKESGVFKTTIKKGLVVLGIVLLLTGWWFIRNYIIYDGDILGLDACNQCAELYALPELKPSFINTHQEKGLSLWNMLFQDKWLMSTMGSFIARFGFSDIYIAPWMYWAISIMLLLGIAGTLINAKRVWFNGEDKARTLLHWMFVLTILLTVGISMYYSYTADYQPQGRYCLPMVTALMYLVVYGIQRGGEFLRNRSQVAEKIIVWGMVGVFAIITILSYFIYFAPAYAMYQ